MFSISINVPVQLRVNTQGASDTVFPDGEALKNIPTVFVCPVIMSIILMRDHENRNHDLSTFDEPDTHCSKMLN